MNCSVSTPFIMQRYLESINKIFLAIEDKEVLIINV